MIIIQKYIDEKRLYAGYYLVGNDRFFYLIENSNLKALLVDDELERFANEQS